MSFTYTTLKTAIKDYTENNEPTFVRNIPVFIKNSEERILKNVQLSLFQRNDSGVLSQSNKFLACPDDFLAPFALSYTDANNEHVFLDFKDVDYVQSFSPNPTNLGEPRYYAQYDVNNFILAPTPNANRQVELNYFYRPASITSSQFSLTLSSVSGTFTSSDTVTGSTSLQSSKIASVTNSTTFVVAIPAGDFIVGETLTGSSSGATGTLEAIGADATETWLSQNAEIAMLYGSLMESYVFMKGEPDLQAIYEKRFGEAVMGLKMLGEAREVTDEYRTGKIVRAKK
tara:strand:+ start:2835 stop:3692 length:858 start_codon:yes stop_codon:yes gene_type:complete